jgi:hypothetical protein
MSSAGTVSAAPAGSASHSNHAGSACQEWTGFAVILLYCCLPGACTDAPISSRPFRATPFARRSDIHEGVFVKTGARRARDYPNIHSASSALAERHETLCGRSHSHRRRRTAPCRASGCDLSPALDLDVPLPTSSLSLGRSPPKPKGAACATSVPPRHQDLGRAGRRGPESCQPIAPGRGPAGSARPARGLGPQPLTDKGSLHSFTPRDVLHFRQSAPGKSTEVSAGTCDAAMLAGSSRTTSPADRRFGAAGEPFPRGEVGPQPRCLHTLVTPGLPTGAGNHSP